MWLAIDKSVLEAKWDEASWANLPGQRGGWLRPLLRLSLNASTFMTLWSEGEETIRDREEMIRCQCCCHRHPSTVFMSNWMKIIKSKWSIQHFLLDHNIMILCSTLHQKTHTHTVVAHMIQCWLIDISVIFSCDRISVWIASNNCDCRFDPNLASRVLTV